MRHFHPKAQIFTSVSMKEITSLNYLASKLQV